MFQIVFFKRLFLKIPVYFLHLDLILDIQLYFSNFHSPLETLIVRIQLKSQNFAFNFDTSTLFSQLHKILIGMSHFSLLSKFSNLDFIYKITTSFSKLKLENIFSLFVFFFKFLPSCCLCIFKILYSWLSFAVGLNCEVNFTVGVWLWLCSLSGLHGRVCQSWPMRTASTAPSAVKPRPGLWPQC